MIDFTFPLPPSVNHYYGHTSNGGMYIKADGKKYREIVKWMSKGKRIDSLVSATVIFAFPDRHRRDIDNGLKCLFDSMKEAGVYPDDSYIYECYMRKGVDRHKKGYVRVILTEYEGDIYL